MKTKESRVKYGRTLLQFSSESNLSALELINAIEELHHLDSSLHRFNELECYQELTEKENRKRESLESRVKKVCKKLGFNFQIGNDPRGASVKILLPSGKSNSWDSLSWVIDF